MAARYLLLDVDNTLYDRTAGVVERVDALINRYLVERLGIEAGRVANLRLELRRDHGTTLRGLMQRDGIDPDDYLRFIHAVDVNTMLEPDAALAAMLGRIPLPKVAVTNGARAHAHAVLDRLGVMALFFRVYALEQLRYVPKPDPEAFATVLADLPARAADCILVEDSALNLATAHQLGMRTVYVGDGGAPPPEADATIGSILDLEAALAGLGDRAP